MNCFFLRLRKFITFVISTSLNVVSIAVLLDTSNNFLEAVFLRRDIFSLVTGFVGFCGAACFLGSSFYVVCAVCSFLLFCDGSTCSFLTTSFVCVITSHKLMPFSRVYLHTVCVALTLFPLFCESSAVLSLSF